MAKKREQEEQTSVAEPERQFHSVELFSSFAHRHGKYIVTGDATEVRPGVYGQRILFEDGAEAQSNHATEYSGQEPPLHPVANGRKRLEYAEEMLKREVKDYNGYRANIAQQADFHLKYPGSCPPPDADFEERLAAGEQRIERWKARIAELNEILSKLDPVRIEKRQRAEADMAAYDQRKALYDKVMARTAQVQE